MAKQIQIKNADGSIEELKILQTTAQDFTKSEQTQIQNNIGLSDTSILRSGANIPYTTQEQQNMRQNLGLTAEGSGTKVQINNQIQDTIIFTSNPQDQLNTHNTQLNTIDTQLDTVNTAIDINTQTLTNQQTDITDLKNRKFKTYHGMSIVGEGDLDVQFISNYIDLGPSSSTSTVYFDGQTNHDYYIVLPNESSIAIQDQEKKYFDQKPITDLTFYDDTQPNQASPKKQLLFRITDQNPNRVGFVLNQYVTVEPIMNIIDVTNLSIKTVAYVAQCYPDINTDFIHDDPIHGLVYLGKTKRSDIDTVTVVNPYAIKPVGILVLTDFVNNISTKFSQSRDGVISIPLRDAAGKDVFGLFI